MAVTITDELVEEILDYIRVNATEKSRAEVTTLILAGVADLSRQGVRKISLDDPLTKQVIRLYCKGHYGYDDGEKFLRSYEALSAAMALDYLDYASASEEGDS